MVVRLGCRSIVEDCLVHARTKGSISSIKRREKKMVVLKQSIFKVATV